MSQRDNDNADRPIWKDRSRAAHTGDGAEEGRAGRTLAVNLPGAASLQEAGGEDMGREDKEEVEGVTERVRSSFFLKLGN